MGKSKKKEIHYMNKVRLLKATTTSSEKFFMLYGDNNVPYGTMGIVKEVHGNNVTIDCDFGWSFTVRIFVTRDDLEVIPYD